MNVIVDCFYILVFLEYVTFCDKVCFVKLCFYDYEMIMFLNVRILNLGGYNYLFLYYYNIMFIKIFSYMILIFEFFIK